ncbi:uncharacterized protein LOC142766062 [Rhipicephalus microplus]|uniref:uncharacterized protein LOC142766062 n=1 Tax=Rhipicephalus microplus TaxID=6941 RepID=UPI003F6A60F1
MLANTSARIRTARPEDIPGLLDIKRMLRQLCGEATPQALQTLDPRGFLVAVTDAGELYGGCSISILSESVAMVGFWCVRPELRHSTLPEQLLRAALRRAGERNVVLRSDGCTVRQLQHAELFPCVGRWLFHKVGPELPRLDALPAKVEGVRVMDFNPYTHTDPVGWYATDVLKIPMKEYLSALSKQPGIVFKVAVEGRAVCGLGTIERDVGGCAIVRHLTANSLRVAQLLVRTLIVEFPPATSVGVCMVASGKRFSNEAGPSGGSKPAFFYEPLGLQYVSTMLMAFTQREPHIDYKRVFALYAVCSLLVVVTTISGAMIRLLNQQ